MNPHKIYVINNAINWDDFIPGPNLRHPKDKINIVILSRLTYRKGIDLVINVIPRICEKYPDVHVIIGGDGIKKQPLVEIRDKYSLNDRIEFLGAVPHNEVRGVLCRGHIFLNTSLIEAFCIALLEAASCGLLVVSTNVGGIPEILPPDMMYLANPVECDIEKQLEKAINDVGWVSTDTYHQKVKELYSWPIVAAKTEKVYESIMKNKNHRIGDRLKIWFSSGYVNGFFHCVLIAIFIIVFWVWEYFVPESEIDQAVDFPVKKYLKLK